MSSSLQFDFPDRRKEFQQQVLACETELSRGSVYDAAMRETLQQLEDFIKTQVLTLPLDSLPSDRQSQWPSIQIEIQRTLRLMSTDCSFWQTARSGDRQRHYQARLLAHCQQLAQFAQAIV